MSSDTTNNDATNNDAMLRALDRLVGTWTTEATHPAMPGVVVHGTAEFAWLEGQRFLILRASNDHPDFPDSISILGFMDQDRAGGAAADNAQAGETRLYMHYFDSRGVSRFYETSIDRETTVHGAVWRQSRNAPGFSQRFTGTFSSDGDFIDGRWQACEDGHTWADDLAISYRRATS